MAAGSLFTQFFLQDGIRQTASYRAMEAAEVEAARQGMLLLWRQFARMSAPSEAETEEEFIFPVLTALGWEWLVQPRADRRRRDVADALLFVNAASKHAAQGLPPTARFDHGAVIVENEAPRTSLDRAPATGEAPASQILRYMSRADSQSSGTLRWGLLTNGRTWRLYDVRARSRAEGFVAIDLVELLDPPPLAPVPVPPGAPPDHWMRVFLLLFGRGSFVPSGPGGATFVGDAIVEGRSYEARITEALSAKLFDQVFPALIRAVRDHDPEAAPEDPAWRAQAREGAIRLLYRLLFLFYAEDRDLLPVRNAAYRDYSLQQLRHDAAALMDKGQPLSSTATRRWGQLTELFGAISGGDSALGLPPYNGSLFREEPGDILARLQLPDKALVHLVDAMSREGAEGAGRRWINYRDLSVQHLGSIYERLLEQDVAWDAAAGLVLRPSPYARKSSGSYYTREELVALILRQTVAPLIEERRLAFAAAADALGPRPAQGLDALPDLAAAILSLRICDPAMGSGHFLVSLVDLLTDAILTAMAEAAARMQDLPYRSPVSSSVVDIRTRIRDNAAAHRWDVPDDQLDDRHIVRRMVLKRCVFGVDLNLMAVELAKLSLWLHSFTVGAPLSFLDHHLRCGDSLFGEFVGPAVRQLQSEFGLAITPAIVAAQAAAARMAGIEDLADADVAEVRQSRRAFDEVEAATRPLRAFLDLYHASRWISPAADIDKLARKALFGGAYGDPVAIMQGAPLRRPTGTAEVRKATAKRAAVTVKQVFEAAQDFVRQARAVSAEGRFLHWQAVFPGVWTDWLAGTPGGGFDGVIGNPPWDRIKMQEVEWWASRQPLVARLSRASDRKRAIAARRAAGDPLAAEYDRAAERSKRAAEVAGFVPKDRTDGRLIGPYALYPLFAKGDVNLYALFVERAGQLVAQDGIVGVLAPSGVAADKGASAFFRSIADTGRLGALLDFENRRPSRGLEPFFPAVDSRFKFCALVHGGPGRRFPEARCAFFQQDAIEAEANAFPVAPADFALVNPNTGTAPVFRTRRDAEIVLGIYRRCPVLVDRRHDPPRALYPISYTRQFDMTNDSRLFRTAEELEAEGAYPVVGGNWERGNVRYLPLMTGRSIHIFDHRFASVIEEQDDAMENDDASEGEIGLIATRSRNVHNPFASSATTEQEHENPAYAPTPRHWVAESDISERWPDGLRWTIAFRDIARATDVRTAIFAVVPRAGYANTAPLLLPTSGADYARTAPLLLANLNSMPLDFIARTKVQSTHLNSYILEQLPLIASTSYSRRFGPRTAEEIVREDVLALTYTAHDLAPFARDQGHDGPPFPWDEEDRLRRRARLDAVYMLLYGLDRATAGHVIDSFPIVRREEVARFGRFRSRDLILRFMAALEAGQPDAAVQG